MTSKSCDLKGRQKIFVLHQNLTSSCCMAHPILLDSTKPLAFYENLWQDESRQLDAGIEIDGCKHCWMDEHNGRQSYRQLLSVNHPAVDKQFNLIEIWLSNLCNQMCSYCSPKYSSEWQSTIKQHGAFTGIRASSKLNLQPIVEQSDHSEYWLDQIENHVNSCEDNSVIIKLLGGEPLLQIRNLEKLLTFNLDKIKELHITTNLNPPNNKFLVWLLDNFPLDKLVMDVSLDATPEYNQYPRGIFNADAFNENVELLKSRGVNFKFLAAVSVLSLFDLPNFLQWRNQNQYRVDFHKLNNPECLTPELIPYATRQAIWNQIENLDPPQFIKETLFYVDDTKMVDLKLIEQYNYLSQYFDRLHMDPRLCTNLQLVEYWNWLESNYRK